MTGRRAPVGVRMAAKIVVDAAGCWTWTAAKDRNGYGKVHHDGEARLAHRVAYQLLLGPIPGDLPLDHLCRNRACCNPLHLEPVTIAENTLRGESPKVVLHRQGVCANGHELAVEACYRTLNGRPSVAYCRACRREKRRAA